MRRPVLPLVAALIVSLLAPAAGAATGGPIDLRVSVAGADATVAPGPDIPAGDQVYLTYEVENTTDQWLWSVYLYQEGIGRITCPERHLAPGAVIVCDVAVTAASGSFAREAFVTAWPSGGAGVEDAEVVQYTGVTPAPSHLVNLALGAAASQSSSTQWTVGTPASRAVDGNRDGAHDAGSVAITYRVSEAWWEVDLGAVRSIDHIVLWNRTDCCADRLRRFHVFVSDQPFAVKDIKGTRDQAGVWDWFQEAAAGRSAEIPVGRTGRYVRVQLDYVDAVLQLAEVEVFGSTGAVPEPAAPTLALEASVGGDTADRAPGPDLTVGASARLDYTVTNTSSQRLWALYIHHEGIGRISCPRRNLAPAETVVCTREIVVAAGSHAAVVTAQAWTDDGTEAAASDAVHWTAAIPGQVAGAAIRLQASVDGDPADDAPGPEKGFGASLAYSYLVENVGTEEVWALYIDHRGATASACPTRHLLPGDTITCTATGLAAAGTVVVDVSASVWDAAGNRASALDPVAYHTEVDPDDRSLAAAARVNGASAATAPGPVVARGSTATLEFGVTNTGGTDLWGLWVHAPGFGAVPCADRHLPPGAATSCVLVVTASPGGYDLRARVVAYDEGGSQAETSAPMSFFVPAGPGASVALEFLVDGLDGDTPSGPRIKEGEVMTFSYLVSNTGAVPVTGVAVSDDSAGAIACPDSTIQPGDTLVCTRRLTARLIETSILARVATAQGATDSERLYYHVKPYGREDELILEVTINGIDADAAPGPNLAAGSTATIRYVLTNNANQATMWSAQILDPRVPSSAMRCTGGPTLGHYQSMVCTATIRIEAGQWSNQVIGYAWSNNGPRLDASDRVHYYGLP